MMSLNTPAPPIPPAAIADALALLKAVENAAETRALIEQLGKATAEHNEALRLLSIKEADINHREKTVDAAVKVNEERSADLSRRVENMVTRANQLDDKYREIAAKSDAREIALNDREAALVKREQALAVKRNEILGAFE